MPEYEVAHYYRLLYGALTWGLILAAILLAVMMANRAKDVTGPEIVRTRPAWLGAALFAAAVLSFFSVAPFVAYGPGPSPTSRGISMVVASQAGYATSFLLVGLLAAGLGRLVGIRRWLTTCFVAGTAVGIALAAVSAARGGYSWLLAPP